MSWITIGIASFLSAALGALGMGGGGVLVLYLTAYAGMEQLAAQGINLVFFVPVAAVALLIHQKNKRIVWSATVPCVILGSIGVYFGAKLAMLLGSQALSKLFGVFLLLIGARELLASPKKEGKQDKGKK